MIVTLRSFAGAETDLDFPGPRGEMETLPLCFLYDGRLFWKHGFPSSVFVEERVDDLSRYTVMDRRQPPGFAARDDVLPAAETVNPSTDENEPLEID